MSALLALKIASYTASALAGYGIGRYYGKRPVDKQEETPKEDK